MQKQLELPTVPFEASFFGSYGPVGDLPLHLFFLMGMEVFCKDCILSVYAAPGMPSPPAEPGPGPWGRCAAVRPAAVEKR